MQESVKSVNEELASLRDDDVVGAALYREVYRVYYEMDENLHEEYAEMRGRWRRFLAGPIPVDFVEMIWNPRLFFVEHEQWLCEVAEKTNVVTALRQTQMDYWQALRAKVRDERPSNTSVIRIYVAAYQSDHSFHESGFLKPLQILMSAMWNARVMVLDAEEDTFHPEPPEAPTPGHPVLHFK